MVNVSKQQSSRSYHAVTIGLRLFLPCVLIVAFFDVKSLRFLRQGASSIRGRVVSGTNDTTVSDSVAAERIGGGIQMIDNVAAGDTDVDGTPDVDDASKQVEDTEVSMVKETDVPTDTNNANKDTLEEEETKMQANAAVSSANSKNKNATTTCLDPKGPQPYVLLARGRSGSGSTLQVLGTLTGEHIHGDHEFTGSTPGQARKFFFQKVGSNDGGKWVLDYLCDQQRQHPNAGLVAFKWKPYTEAMFSPAALAGLELMSRAVDPVIKVVRLRRNLLDNFISDRKHELAKVSSHCAAENLRCIAQHKEAGANLTLSVPDLVAFLESETNQEDNVDKFLVNMSVPHVQVSYEKLYHQDNADEWMEIFKFLGVGPAEGLTREQVDGSAHAFTGSPHHRAAIKNYDEVEKGLKGTRFANLLRP